MKEQDFGSYQPYIPQYRDFVANSQPYEASAFKPSTQKYEYKPYKPSHVGMYGDKPRVKKPAIKPETQITKPKSKRPIRTFDSYRGPRGPDMKTVDYKPAKFENGGKTYVYKPSSPYKPQNYRGGNDPLKHRTTEFLKPKDADSVKRPPTYKLTRENYAGKNNWNFGFITDPMPWRGRDGEPSFVRENTNKPRETKTIPKKTEEPKPEKIEEPKAIKKVEKAKEVPAQKAVAAAAIIPVAKRPKTPEKKTFKTTSTQHVPPALKTVPKQTISSSRTPGTQYETSGTKHTHVQTDERNSPLNAQPIVMAAAIPPSTRPKMKSEGVQCSDQRVKTIGQGTQCDLPALTQQPMVFAEPKERRSYEVQEQRQQTPVYRPAPLQRTPSPQVLPIVAVAAHPRTPSPVQHKQEPVVAKETAQPQQYHPTPARQAPTIAPVYAPIITTKPNPERKSANPQPDKSRWTPTSEKTGAESINKAPAYLKPPTPQKSPVVPRNEAPYIKQDPRSKSQQKPAENHIPKMFVSPRVSTPPEKSREPINERPTGNGTYQSYKSRLPPEVTACIEAYGSAHKRTSMPGLSGTVPTMVRSGAI